MHFEHAEDVVLTVLSQVMSTEQKLYPKSQKAYNEHSTAEEATIVAAGD